MIEIIGERADRAAIHLIGDLTGNLTGDLVWVDGDPARLDRALRHLLDNARTFTPSDGRITVDVRGDGDNAIIEIADTGAGMSPEMLSSAFDAFVQGEQSFDRARGGLGLGLALVRHIIELHQGTVRLASPGATREVRVLIVEDQEELRESLVALLTMMTLETRAAANAGMALDALSTWTPDLILLDLGLPDLDGFELARRIRSDSRLDAVRVVALTGFGEEAARAKAEGFDDFLVKPASRKILQQQLELSVERHR